MRSFRRTIFTFGTSYECETWPLVISADETFYFKPEGLGQLLGSPADEHLDRPCDARPREIDVATGIEAINHATTRFRAASGAPAKAARESRPRRPLQGSRPA